MDKALKQLLVVGTVGGGLIGAMYANAPSRPSGPPPVFPEARDEQTICNGIDINWLSGNPGRVLHNPKEYMDVFNHATRKCDRRVFMRMGDFVIYNFTACHADIPGKCETFFVHPDLRTGMNYDFTPTSLSIYSPSPSPEIIPEAPPKVAG